MATEPNHAGGTAVIDTALRGMRDTLAADGYELQWAMEEQNQIGIRVVAGPEACADCLVPPEIMRAIVSNALKETPYDVGSISLPAEPAGSGGHSSEPAGSGGHSSEPAGSGERGSQP